MAKSLAGIDIEKLFDSMGKTEKDVFGEVSTLVVPGLAIKILTDLIVAKLTPKEKVEIGRKTPDKDPTRQGYPVGLGNLNMFMYGSVFHYLIHVPLRNRAILENKEGERHVVSLKGFILSKENMQLRKVVANYLTNNRSLPILVEFHSRLKTI